MEPVLHLQQRIRQPARCLIRLRSLHLGAEACFFKPLTDYDPLADALADCFRKIDRWWAVLEDLGARRKAEWEERAAVVESESSRTGLS